MVVDIHQTDSRARRILQQKRHPRIEECPKRMTGQGLVHPARNLLLFHEASVEASISDHESISRLVPSSSFLRRVRVCAAPLRRARQCVRRQRPLRPPPVSGL